MRVAVIGNSGSGKSFLARKLAAEHDLPILDLDLVAWEPGVSPPTRRDAREDVRAFCTGHEGWVVEGCYGDLIEATFEFGPELIFLDASREQCRANCLARPWEPSKYESKGVQDAFLPQLLAWVDGYFTEDRPISRANHLALFESYGGDKTLERYLVSD